MSCCTDYNECDPSLQVLAGTVALTATHATELLVARPGLFGQVITAVSAPSRHVPMLRDSWERKTIAVQMCPPKP